MATKHTIGELQGSTARPLATTHKRITELSKPPLLLSFLYQYVNADTLTQKAGRTAAKPLITFYYVMNDEATSTLDRVLVYAALLYTVSPVSLIPASVYHLLGVLDEGAAIGFAYKKIKDKITPEIRTKVNDTLDEWFGAEVEKVEAVPAI